ncbi:hypothetical protein [Moorena producens]
MSIKNARVNFCLLPLASCLLPLALRVALYDGYSSRLDIRG